LLFCEFEYIVVPAEKEDWDSCCYSKFLALKKKKEKRKKETLVKKKKDERGNKKVGIAEISQPPATSFSLFLPWLYRTNKYFP
jgi:hypothetical protein